MLYVKVAKGSMDEVCKKVEAATVAQKFGVLGSIDLKAKMNAKGVAFGPEVRVLEVCSPTHAKRALETDMVVSTVLPCRISVYQDNGTVKVATMKPTVMLDLFGKPELAPLAREVEAAMVAIIDAACA
jgi:uncharacterized protein (DUF302 family)